MGLRGKLIQIFYRAATGSRQIRTLLTPVGIAFFFRLIVLLIVVSLQVDKCLEFPKLLSTSWNITVPAPILAIGLSLVVWSGVHFFILFNVLELKAVEEPELEKRLGKEYVEYKKRVPMFIPRLKVRT